MTAKTDVKAHWELNPCNAEMGGGATLSRAYFDQIEMTRYSLEPEIHQFAQFSRYHGKNVLEVGVGMGTDFVQWVRCGAKASGIDLTEEGIRITRARIEADQLKFDGVLRQADAENLPFADDSFDLAYSWGVIHHSPDTRSALREILRVIRPGGEGKIMIYNKWSAIAIMYWCLFALFRARPWKTISQVFAEHVESPGTKVYSRGEARALFDGLPVRDIEIHCYRKYFTVLSRYPAVLRPMIRFAGEIINFALGGTDRAGYFLTVKFRKATASRSTSQQGD